MFLLVLEGDLKVKMFGDHPQLKRRIICLLQNANTAHPSYGEFGGFVEEGEFLMLLAMPRFFLKKRINDLANCTKNVTT